MGCFTFEELLAGCETTELPQPIRAHVAEEGCEVCARRLALVRRMLELLPALRLEAPPARVLAAARKTPARARRQQTLVLEAVLPAPGVVPAFRSGAPASARRQLYRTGPYELDLALHEDGSLLGEVVSDASGAEWTAGECTLYGALDVRQAQLDSEGFFRLEKLVPGRHVLVLALDGALLVVPDLEIPA